MGSPRRDRPSRPRRLTRSTPFEAETRVLGPRRSILLAPLVLAAAGAFRPAPARGSWSAGLPRLADVDRATGEVWHQGPITLARYEKSRPGEPLCVDVKKVTGVPEGGGRRALGRSEDPYGGHSRAETSYLFAAGSARRVCTRPHSP